MEFKTRFKHGGRVQIDASSGGRTKQEFREECDINNILKKYKRTGILPQMIKANPSYGDFSDVGSYQEACNIVLFAQEQFAALPASTRDKFGNDPAVFLEFVNDPKNADEMVAMGLATKKETGITPGPVPQSAEAEDEVRLRPSKGGKPPRSQGTEPSDD